MNFIVHHRNCKLMNKHQDILLVLLGRHEVLVVVVMGTGSSDANNDGYSGLSRNGDGNKSRVFFLIGFKTYFLEQGTCNSFPTIFHISTKLMKLLI